MTAQINVFKILFKVAAGELISERGVFMNLPNYITLGRIILIPVFIDLMVYGYYRWALVVFVIAGASDALDGLIARQTKTQTELGAFLDPLADKLLIVSALVTLVILGKLPAWLVIIVISRDVIVASGSLIIYFTGRDIKIRPSLVGKITTGLQLAVVVLALVLTGYGTYHPEVQYIALLHWTTASITVVSGIQYVVRGIRMVG